MRQTHVDRKAIQDGPHHVGPQEPENAGEIDVFLIYWNVDTNRGLGRGVLWLSASGCEQRYVGSQDVAFVMC